MRAQETSLSPVTPSGVMCRMNTRRMGKLTHWAATEFAQQAAESAMAMASATSVRAFTPRPIIGVYAQ